VLKYLLTMAGIIRTAGVAAAVIWPLAAMGSAGAQVLVGGDDNVTPGYGEDGTEGDIFFLRRMTARTQIRALWRRYGAQGNALLMDQAPAAGQAGVTPVSGSAQGPLGNGWTIWSTSEASLLRDRRATVASRGHSLSMTFGVDRQWTPAFNAGVSINAIGARQKTLFNGGHAHSLSLGISPYFQYAFADWLKLDASGGYVYNREKMSRTLPWAATGLHHSNGYMLSAALNASRWAGAWLLSGRAGVIVTRDAWGAYTESDGTFHFKRTDKLTQGVIEATVSYWLDPLMPYAGIAYTRDLASNDPVQNDKDDFTFTAGAAWYGSGALEGLTADFSGAFVVGRKGQRNTTFSLGLRWNF